MERNPARPRPSADRKPDSIGVDTWGCDYALLDARGKLVEQPYHYRDVRTDGVMEAVWQRVSREEIYAITGIQFLVFNTLYQLYAACQKNPALIDIRRLVRHDSRSSELLVDGRAARRIHHGDDDAVRRCDDARLGERAARRSSIFRRGCCRR